jgi:hypothetical protein
MSSLYKAPLGTPQRVLEVNRQEDGEAADISALAVGFEQQRVIVRDAALFGPLDEALQVAESRDLPRVFRVGKIKVHF